VTASEANEFALFDEYDGPIAGGTYGTAGASPYTGQVVAFLYSGEEVGLESVGFAGVSLPTDAGGLSPNANASILIEQVG
jgi:hypothetical protein